MKKILVIFTILICALLAISAVNASDIVLDDSSVVTDTQDLSVQTVATDDITNNNDNNNLNDINENDNNNLIIEDNNGNWTENTDEISNVKTQAVKDSKDNKLSDPSTDPVILNVNSYAELVGLFADGQPGRVNENIVINLLGDDDYDVTGEVNLNPSHGDLVRNIVINGNNKIIDGKQTYRFIHLTASNPGVNLTLNDLTIKNCKPQNSNGAIFVDLGTNSNLTINNVLFDNNFAPYYDGGAIKFFGVSLTITNSNFTNNYATDQGGAIYADSNNGFLNITNCIFSNNHADDDECDDGDGGAIHIMNFVGTVVNTTFNSNHGYDGGSIYTYQTDLEIINCNFTGNVANYEGGAVYNDKNSKVTVFGSNFESNSAVEYGGAIYNYEQLITVVESNFTSNIADQYGTGIFSGSDTVNILVNTNLNDNNIFGYNPNIRYNFTVPLSDFNKGSSIELSVTETRGFEGTVNVTIGDEVFAIPFADGYGSATVTPQLNVGTYDAYLVFKATDDESETSVLLKEVNVLEKTYNFTATVPNITKGESIDIVVTENTGFEGYVNVTIGDEVFAIPFADGYGCSTVTPTLALGTYEANLTYQVLNDEEITNKFIGEVTVSARVYNFTATVPDITKGESIDIVVTENTGFVGTVNVTIGDEVFAIPFADGYGCSTVTPTLALGTYDANLTYQSNTDPDIKTKALNQVIVAERVYNFTVTVPDITKGESIDIVVTEDTGFEGEVNVTIGDEVFAIPFADGYGCSTVTPTLALGTYDSSLTYQSNSDPDIKTKTLNQVTVSARVYNFTATVPDILKGYSIDIVVTENTGFEGEVNVTIGTEVYNIPFADGHGSLTVTPNLALGTYDANLIYQSNSDPDIKTIALDQVTVSKRVYNFTSVIPDFLRGDTIDIDVTENTGFVGTIKVRLDSEEYVVPFGDGEGSTSVSPGLDIGTYHAYLLYMDEVDEDFTSIQLNDFTVDYDAIDYTVINDISGKVAIEIMVYDSTGEEITGPNNVTLTLDGVQIGSIKPCRVYRNTELTPGEYTILASYGTHSKEINITVIEDPVIALNERIDNLTQALNQTQENLTAANEKIDNLSSALEETQANLTAANERIGELNDTVNDLNSALTETQNNLTAANQKIDDLNATVSELNTTLNEKTAELNNANARIDELNTTVNDLNSALTETQANLTAANERIDNLTAKVDSLNGTLTEKIAELNTAKENIDNLTNEVNDLNTALSEAQANITAANGRIDELNGTVTQLNTSLNEKTAELNAANERIDNLTTQVNALNSTLIETQANLTAANENVEELNSKVTELNNTLNAKIAELDAAKADIANLNASVTELNGTLNERTAELNLANERIDNLTNEVNALNNTLNQTREDLALANQNVEDLSSKVDQINGTLNEKIAELNTANEKIDNLTNDVTTLNTTLNNKIEELDSAKADIASLNSTVTDLNSTLNEKIEELNTANEKIDNLTTQVNSLNTTLNQTKEDLAVANQNIETLNGQVDQINGTLNEKIEELNTANEKIGNLTNDVTDLNTTLNNKIEELDQAKADIVQLNSTVTDLNNTLNERTAELNLANEKIDNLTDDVTSINSTLNEKITELDSAKADIAQLNATVTDLNDTLNERTAELNLANEKINNLTNDVTALNSTLNEKITELDNAKADIVQLNATVTDLNNTLNEKIEELNNAQGDIAVLNATVTELNNTLNERTAELNLANEKINNLTDDVTSINSTLNEKITELDSAKADIAQLNSTVTDLNNTLNERTAELNLANEKISNLTDDVTSINSTLNEKITELNNANADIAQLNATVTELNNTLNERTAELNTANEKINNLTDDVTAINSTLNEKIAELDAANARIDNLTDDVTAINSTLNEKIEELNNAQGDIAALNATVTQLNNTLNEKIAELDAANADIAQLNATVTDLNNTLNEKIEELNTANARIDNLTGDVTAINGTLNEKIEELNATNARIDNLTEEVSDLESELNETQDNLTNANAQIGDLQSELKETQDNLTDANGQIADLNNQLSNLNQEFNDKVTELETANNDLNSTVKSLNNTLNERTEELNNLEKKVDDLSDYVASIVDTLNTKIDLIADDGKVNINLKDSKGQGIAGAELDVFVDDIFTPVNPTDVNGDTSVSIDENATVRVSYKDSNNVTVTETIGVITIVNTTYVTPNRTATVIHYQNMSTTAVAKVDGRVGEYFEVTLTDDAGNPLANKTVYIGFNGVVYTRTTNATGGVRLQINLGYEGDYTFAMGFIGDDNYTGSFEVAVIKVAKHTPKLTAPSKTYKASAKTKAVTATFKSANNNPIPDKKITFTVNGKTYSATTNSKGVATVNVSLSTKGTYTCTAKYAGDKMYKATSTSFKLQLV